MTRAAGLDVGGTKILGVVVDDTGAVIQKRRIATPQGGDAIIGALASLARDLGPYDTLGVGIAGLVTRGGVLRASPNLAGSLDVPVGPALVEQLGHPVEVDNDATCAGLAEWRLGAARGHDHVVAVTLGTGVGGGIVLDGRLQRGVNGFAGEFGHMVVEATGVECVCGQRGCWERYASGSALQRMAGGRRGEDVVAAVRAGDAASAAVIDEFAHWVALGLAN
ncbi:MAG TPA: ROK family protein, partial [Ilumatobacteraceae bacterium]|nr:ROK family protein [Ilumatobacteraceae bacterium]